MRDIEWRGEMKTLKDLPTWNSYDDSHAENVGSDDLRAAAIEWIKELRKIDFDSMDDKAKFFSNNKILSIWICTFFNLTEADLEE